MGLFQEITQAIQKANLLPHPPNSIQKEAPSFAQLVRPSNKNDGQLPHENTEDYQG